MDYFEKKASEPDLDLPLWVKTTNGSYKAYLASQKLFYQRLDYIQNHNRPSHYKYKKNYQISGSEVAVLARISKPTLLSTSTYSIAFKSYLFKLNEDLLKSKEQRLNRTKISRSRGPVATPKVDLIKEIQILKNQVELLRNANVLAQVESTFSMLSPEIRSILGFGKPSRTASKVIPISNPGSAEKGQSIRP